jgi:V/A-type H+-transporting ATPase subunit D
VADGTAQRSVSRSAFLELREEERLVHTGYEFLDEKRVQLAAGMLRERETYRELRKQFIEAGERAAAALLEAAAAHGLEALQVKPANELDEARVTINERRFVGLALVAAHFDTGVEPGAPGSGATGLVQDCIDAFMTVVDIGVRLAAVTTSLERLMHEYERTERRVRALENVILPEIRSELTVMEEYLDLNEQEEVIRVRSIRQQDQTR